jgi:uncharacterized protein (TIGR02246 family)
MDAWGSYFTDDADFVTHGGIWWASRDENVEGHKNIPESVVYQKKTYVQHIATIREIAPGVALVHTRWRWPNHVPPAADAPEDRGGIISYVLVKRRDRWLIRAAHNTRHA